MIEKYSWTCSRPGCKKTILAYTEGGRRAFSEDHMAQHVREDRQLGQQATAISLFRGTPKNYNILILSASDIAFLRTRLITIDDNIECDWSAEPKPTNDELKQGEWKEILRRAWKN